MKATPTHATALSRRLAGFVADQRGATAIEYALLGAVVAILAIGGLQALGGGAGGLYDAMDTIAVEIAKALDG